MRKPKIVTCISIHRVLTGIGDNLFKLFYPVLIYNATHSLKLAVLFMLVMFASICLSTMLFKKLFYKHALVFISINVAISLVVQLIFTLNIAFTVELVVVVAILNGIFRACYWTPVNTLFASNKSENANKALKTFEITSLFGQMIAPAVGGLLLGSGNMIVSLSLSAVIYISSLIVLYIHYKQIANTFRRIELEQPQTIYKFVKKQNIMYYSYWFVYGFVDIATSYLWPLLLAVRNVSVASIGIVTSASLVGQIVSQFLASYLGSKNKWYTPASICMVLRIGFLIAMPFILTPITMIVYSVVVGLFIPVYNSPIMAEYIKFSDKNNILLNNMNNREFSINCGKFAGSLLLAAGVALVPALIITSTPYLFAWIYHYILKKQHKNNTNIAPSPPADYTKGTYN